jgi:plasmid stability protein
MAAHRVTLDLPQDAYEQLRQRAAQAQRSVEAEAAQTVERALAEEARQSEEGVPSLEALNLLDSEALREVVAGAAAPESALLLGALSAKREQSGLTVEEEELVSDLIRRYDRAVLLRSRALLLLHQRGVDVSAIIGEA